MNFAVVIPSKNLSNLWQCVFAVKHCEPKSKIVVVDDGIEWFNGEFSALVKSSASLITGAKPFAFPRNVNTGIKRAIELWPETTGFVVLNDDALLKSPGGFSLLQQVAELKPEYGLVSSTTNVAGNPQQFPKDIGLRDADRTVAFVCVYIPRRTVSAVGLMDERFGGFTPDGRRIYGFCDNDYCRRVRDAGLKIGIHDGCFVDHSQLESSFRGKPTAAGDISAAQEIYLAKWGDLN